MQAAFKKAVMDGTKKDKDAIKSVMFNNPKKIELPVKGHKIVDKSKKP